MSSCESESASAYEGSPLTIRHVARIKEELIPLFDERRDLEWVVGADVDVDVAGVQLILSARRCAQALGVQLVLKSPRDSRLKQILELGGFLAGASEDDLAFWSSNGADA
jgi:anti-anti-sigma regulatory factor